MIGTGIAAIGYDGWNVRIYRPANHYVYNVTSHKPRNHKQAEGIVACSSEAGVFKTLGSLKTS